MSDRTKRRQKIDESLRKDVFRLFFEGLSSKAIASRLGYSDVYIRKILHSRLGTSTHNKPVDGITNAEKEILGFLREGLSTQQISQLRHVAPRTVDTQISTLFRKADCKNRIQLIE